LNERIVPALQTLLSAAIERDRLQVEAIEADALRRIDEIKTAVLRAVSHDLRTPLTAIVAAGDALGSPSLSSDERKTLSDSLTGEASRLARLVDQLLDLSRLEAGAAEPRWDWCSIEEITMVAAEQIPDRSRFELSFERDLPLLHADAAQLERALVNVLENAARHSGKRPVSVRTLIVGSNVVVRVVDQGPGIAASQLDQVFEPFHRGHGSSSGGHRGSGLGLAIAKGFIEANGGSIRAESPPGEGTTIVIELPVLSRPADERSVVITGALRE
jgi:two-component system sensor histidine kinase KdpD